MYACLYIFIYSVIYNSQIDIKYGFSFSTIDVQHSGGAPYHNNKIRENKMQHTQLHNYPYSCIAIHLSGEINR